MPNKSKMEADTSTDSSGGYNARAVARRYIEALTIHEACLDADGLVYLDSLIEELLEVSVLPRADLQHELRKVVPWMTEDEADTVVGLKFPSFGEEDACFPATFSHSAA